MKSEKWLKAAVVGSLWGVSEIVLGSFLHNLRIPFSGNLLTAIGIILMISGHRLWPERGLIIRAGLICAALKTMSPSPNILGPMMAILAQAAIMETVLLAGRRSWAGYLTGGGLAMTWNLFHKIFSSVIIYGGNLIEIYKHLIDYVVKQTGWISESYLGPILVISLLYFLFGSIAAAVGIRISAKTRQSHTPGMSPGPALQGSEDNRDKNVINNRRDVVSEGMAAGRANIPGTTAEIEKDLSPGIVLIRVAGIIALLVAVLYSIRILPLVASAGMLLALMTAAWFYEPRLIMRFGKRKSFWISMSVMILLSGLLLGKTEQGNEIFSLTGFRAGIEMMMRALYVVTGFGVISKELTRKNLLEWFSSRRMGGFIRAANIAFQTTPLLIEAMPSKQNWRRPMYMLSIMIASMEDSLESMRDKSGKRTAQTS